MVVGEYTASNIHMDEDAREEKKKTGIVDMTKLNADIATQKELAAQVQLGSQSHVCSAHSIRFTDWGLFGVQGKLHEALEGLLNLEKMSRLAEDITAAKASCSAVLEVCYQAKQWKLLEEQIMLLAKRRSQLKQVGSTRAIWVSQGLWHGHDPWMHHACHALNATCRPFKHLCAKP